MKPYTKEENKIWGEWYDLTAGDLDHFGQLNYMHDIYVTVTEILTARFPATDPVRSVLRYMSEQEA